MQLVNFVYMVFKRGYKLFRLYTDVFRSYATNY